MDSLSWKRSTRMISFIAFLFFVLSFSQIAHANEEIDLTILHTNDIHASFDEYAKVSEYVKQQRQASSHFLYLDAGDAVSGNPVVDLNDGKPIYEVFNLAGVDAFTLGNHEFDFGQDAFAANMELSEFPWLAANMDVGDTSLEQPKPYEIFDLDGLSVAVFSVTQAPPATAPANTVGLDFDGDYAGVAASYQEELEEQADIIVALTHIGFDQDRRLAEQVDYFDVIIGGHSHTTLNAPNVINGTPIVQTGSNLNNIGQVTLTYDQATDSVTNTSGSLVSVASLTDRDEAVQAVVDGYNEDMEELLGEVVGTSNNGLTRDGRYNGDAPLGNFWTDAMRDMADSDIAFTNNGGIRASIDAGDVTLGDIYQIEPFANEIMVYEMTGQAIKNVLEFSYSRDNRNEIDLQVSGLNYNVLTGPTGSYQDVTLTIGNEPIDLEATYTVAVANYIGTGGSGYNFEGTVISETVGLMTEAMKNFALKLTAEGKTLDYSSEGRIKLSVDPTAPVPGEIIGSTETGLYSANKNRNDVGLGNLYTDSIRTKAGTDIGMLNGSSVTGEINPGSITDQQIESLDGFGNVIVSVNASGSDIKDVILEQAKYRRGVDVQISGLTYNLVTDANGAISDVEISLENGDSFDPSATYTVAYNDYMHGNNFYNLGSDIIEADLGPVWTSVVDYVTAQEGPINYEEGQRITIDGEGSGDDPSGLRSVAEALANNSGTARVKGYIVGSIVNSSPVIGEGTHAPSNLLLADSPDETDRSKMLPVQLVNGTAVRNGLNLPSHPENLGRLITVTGSLEAYFSTPGMRAPTTFTFEEEEPEVPEEPEEPEVPEEPEAPKCEYTAWEANKTYVAGDRIEHDGDFYQAQWWTQNQNPAENSGYWEVWQKVTECYEVPDGPQEWNAKTIYNTGDHVTLDGELYEAKWWTQGQSPKDHSGTWDVWKKISDSEPEGPEEWDASSIYTAGDRAFFDGKLYEAKWWTQNQSPANHAGQWDVWKEIKE
ncbi:5'-nucleotidase C-terminal domain-containing protein [Alkalicoccobacillus porphyridii]|uniref:Multifunctional 2',3'-cyclic-nucleotide 2'-phosphodiesterase/5'-nucleotidase/3'-nucleotidase n=1 Tax=Alkalicoccobacillus porphyridii TaxID=2597270 RepID=A0A553ZTL5_9BACI|nr:5'-nucleotidase C-terminal domain-containing protein [Alkalicoccobacillus porphyridii]TSB44817.1 multifunctional 2',3'-cyclic-nucleotide 2'-phosphodiesterase/5'-nucleotidase/3'-nucleotidase [Alkalicoccobacillus porphyridii]